MTCLSHTRVHFLQAESKKLEKYPAHNLCSTKIGRKNENECNAMFSGYFVDDYLNLKFLFRLTLCLMNRVSPSLKRSH